MLAGSSDIGAQTGRTAWVNWCSAAESTRRRRLCSSGDQASVGNLEECSFTCSAIRSAEEENGLASSWFT